MFRTIKSKTIFMTLSMLIALSLIAFVLTWGSFTNSKRLKMESCDLMIAYFVEQVNKSIQQLQGNVIDLSLMGEIFQRSKNETHELSDFIVKHNFQNNTLAIGGGIWFEPYKILPQQKRFCSYAFHSPKGVLLDKSFEGEKYNYLNQNWYLEIKENINNSKKKLSNSGYNDFHKVIHGMISSENKEGTRTRQQVQKKYQSVFWTKPYYDDSGTYSLITTVGAAIYDKDSNFIGMATSDWKLDSIIAEISEIRPTPNSFALFADKENDFILAITDKSIKDVNMTGKSLKSLSWYKEDTKNGEMFIYKDVKYISFVKKLDNDMILIVNVPSEELFAAIIKRLKYLLVSVFTFCISISGAMYYMFKKNINEPVDYLIETANKIGDGNLDTKMDIKNPKEFADLAKTFNKMTTDIKDYITNLSLANAEKERMKTELNIARSIQSSSLPSIFPPYPDRKEFDIFAKMYPAREVGGDFYDFFFIDDDRLVFLIADVSGKGIPAALFMMTTKTLIKNLAKTGLRADELIAQANKQICKTNEQGIFVTVFLSILELSTGKINCINAGHNPPLFKEKNKDFRYYKCTPNLVVGAMENTVYHSFERKIHPGDCIFLYTDGITEAYNKEDEFYGEERLVEFLNTTKSKNTDIENILLTIKEDVENFAQGEEQADDMTMLILRYNGFPTARKSRAKTKTFLLPADTSRIDSVTKWIQENCTEAKIPDEHKQKLHLAVEEIFVNISNYAYPKGQGDIEISFKIIDGKNAQVQFIDSGKPYNPLEKEDPDITLNAEERAIGGLGIFLAKQMVDIMEYEFRDDRNILTIQLAFLEN